MIYNQARVKFKEPVVVIESDDWGMDRNPMRAVPSGFGTPKYWNNDVLETAEDILDLIELLDRFDARFTPNYVVANPDFQSTLDSDYEDFRFDWISAESIHLDCIHQGIENGIFYPQYHGRSHFNTALWLKDLQEDFEHARELFKLRLNGSFNNFNGPHSKRYHTEYLQWEDEQNVSEIRRWLEEGLTHFENIFGYKSQSICPPHYIITTNVAKNLLALDVKSLQGFRGFFGRKERPYFGKSKYGLTLLYRNVKFEPDRNVPEWKGQQTIQRIRSLTENQYAVVIDTHRVNYTANRKSESLKELHLVLKYLKKAGFKFLTTPELAEAIKNKGYFTHVATGVRDQIELSPGNTIAQKIYNQKKWFVS